MGLEDFEPDLRDLGMEHEVTDQTLTTPEG